MMMKHISVVTCASLAMVCMMCLPLTSENVAAELVEGDYLLVYPSAGDSVFYRYAPNPTTPSDCPAIEAPEDDLEQTVHYAAPNSVYYARCSEFSNESNPDLYAHWSTMPENATINWVILNIRFATASSPALDFRFTANGTTTYEYHEAIPYGNQLYNVTELRDWNYSMLMEMTVSTIMYPAEGEYYYLDYVGIEQVSWHGWLDDSEYGEPNPEEGGLDLDYDFIYNGGIIGAMALVGFLGLIAVPAYAIYLYKSGNDTSDTRIGLFVKMVVVFMFCLTMFMYGIS